MNPRRKYFFTILMLFTTRLLSLSTVFFPLSKRLDFNDSAIYQYIGYLITKGDVPYLDAFDHKGVYFYFLNALGYLINPKWGMWPLIWFALFICALLVLHLANEFLPDIDSLFLTLVIITGIGTSFWDGDTPDFFAELYVLAAFYAMSSFFQVESLSRRRILIIGLFTGIAFWMKPNMILPVLPVCFCIITSTVLHKDFSLFWKCVVYFITGFIVSSLPAIIWLESNGALGAMIDDYFLFNIHYVSFSATNDTKLLAYSKFITLPASIVSIICILLYLVSLLETDEKAPNSNVLLVTSGVVSFIVCLIHASSTGNEYEQYAMLLYPSMIYIISGALLRIHEVWPNKQRLISIICPIATICVLCFNAYKESNYCQYFWSRVPQEDDVLSYIDENSSPNDTIAVISPYNSGYYIATGRDSATKYIYIQANHFVAIEKNPSAESAFWNEYTEDLISAQPRIIMYDNDYLDKQSVLNILAPCLSKYAPGGKSHQFTFYVLPRNKNEEIPTFYSGEKVDDSFLTIPLTEQMREDYKNGKLTKEDLEKMFDQEWEKKKNGEEK